MAMPNHMFLQLSNGMLMTHARADDDYGDANGQRAIAEALISQYHPGESLAAFVLASSDAVTAMGASQGLDQHLSDTFSIVAKKRIPGGSTGIPTEGQTMDDLNADDMCLCYTPPVLPRTSRRQTKDARQRSRHPTR